MTKILIRKVKHRAIHIQRNPLELAAVLLVLLICLSGCGLFAAPEDEQGPLALRTVHPTFTPTVPATPAPVQATPAPQAVGQATPPTEQLTEAKAVINGPLVNARNGPGVEYEIVDEVERGEEFDIVGVSPDRLWWQICCFDGTNAWVTSEFVDTLGLVDSVPVIGAAGEVVAENAPATPIIADPVAPPAEAAPVASFDLETLEQFPETSVVRIFLYVFSGNNALEGYSLRVTKDGEQLPVEGVSFGGQPAFTWPFQDPRQRFQNFKVEFSDVPAAGVWEVQLVDSSGALAGPPATFTLSANDPQQELYVRYVQR